MRTLAYVIWGWIGVSQAQPLLNWVLEHNGAQFDEKRQRIEWGDGVYAAAPIQKNEVLATIPWSVIITPTTKGRTPSDHQAHFSCGLARKVGKELYKGSKSTWAPYLRHLKDFSTKLPSQYSDDAKDLLMEILGGEDNASLLVEKAAHYVFWDWKVLCGAALQDDTEQGAQAAMWVQQHAFHDVMIPLKDLYTHRNGKYHNIEVKLVDQRYAQIIARRDIAVGEKLHTSYTECETCDVDRDEEDYGTPELFRDHGIVESMPQLWSIPENQMRIPYEDEDGEEKEMLLDGLNVLFKLEESENGEIEVVFLIDEIQPSIYTFIDVLFRGRIQELHRLKNIEYSLSADDYNIPQDEWDALWEFHQAYSMALKRAVLQLHKIIFSQNLPTNSFRPQEFCRLLDQWDDHYTDFHVELDHMAYNEPNCESSELIDFFSYQQLELERSNYQEMLWQYRAEDDDTCLHLDGMLQICSSYRPHYHEFFVHFPARYMKSIRRVIFLGSGDAMLLHEILKYPSLEKVVGLELDQTVTRKSFKHFKTQPHYDDPRVEWWYGDATKTLPLLPREYWGSFDLLLVDLSETVVSLHVTGQHDVLDVISMLLNPDGVMLENELYIDKMKQHFDHSIHIFYGSPKVCVQVHTVSSNAVDFMRSPIYNHDVGMYLIDPVETLSDRFRFIHDYAKMDPIADGKCDSQGLDVTTIEHGRKAGIMMVLEAENCSEALDSNVEEQIYTVLREKGLSPISGPKNAVDTTIQIVMKEGYIVARLWPEHRYVGFDLHFWGAFSKMEGVRDALVHMLGSKTTSSYRVVTGGMQGSSTWQDDQNEIGVQFSQKRNCTAPDLSMKELKRNEAIEVALDESLTLLADPRDLVVAVVCGLEKHQNDCLALQLLAANPHVETVIPFYTCEGLPYFNNGTSDFEPMYDCERDIIKRLSSLNDDYDIKIDSFVVDLSAPLSMLQIFASVWSVPDYRDEWLDQPYILAMPFEYVEPERQRFMDIFRKFGHGTVTTMAEFRFQGVHDTLGWRVFTFHDQTAVYSISKMESRLTKRLPNTYVQAQLLEGGQRHRPEDLLLDERSFRPEDYDYGPNAKQMAEQLPLGRQTIFQLESNNTTPSLEELVKALEKTLGLMEYTFQPCEQWTHVGDGAVVTNTFVRGSVVMVWDGGDHVDLNLFCRDETRELADDFLRYFLHHVTFELSLRDDQPRGIGRVVNFQKDIDRNNMAAIDR